MPFGHPGASSRWLAGLVAGLGLAAGARADGGFLVPGRGHVLEAGSRVDVRWSAPCSGESAASETELLLSVDGGLTFPIRLTPEMTPCSRSFRWEVPGLATARARLALRGGAGEGSDAERLLLVSEEFAILATAGGSPEELVPGPREWWTRQALRSFDAEKFPAPTMEGEKERLISPGSSPDISEPSPQAAPLPAVSQTDLPAARDRGRASHCRGPLRAPAAPTPRRL